MSDNHQISGVGHAPWRDAEFERRNQPAVISLECPHCGGEAIRTEKALFYDGDGGKCQECGFPGHVSIDNAEEPATAWWNASEEPGAVCEDHTCIECHSNV